MQGRLPTLVARDDRERDVIEVWRRSGLTDGTIAVYLCSVRPFRNHWRQRCVDEIQRLTYADVMKYARAYVGPRRGRRVRPWSRHAARSAMHAWSCALQLLGVPVPSWRSTPAPSPWPVLVQAYGEYRRSQRGVATSTLLHDLRLAAEFLRTLRSQSRRIGTIRLKDIDDFVDGLSKRLGRRTVAGLCSSLRCFLRFLRATGHIQRDLACGVVAPRFRVDESPPRALPWESVRRILRAIPRNRRVGWRDYAMFLLMAAYGLGAGEVVSLRLDDVDWRAGVLRVRRPKTDVPIELPLLPAVARALASYLRRGRPRPTSVRAFFVTLGFPHRALSTSVLRHQTRTYATRAGITVAPLGSHVFRHSHATRQIDAGASAKIVGDILGHRRPSSISVYVRVALRRLRNVGLPVPR